MNIGKLSATYRNETSYNGYPLDVLKSAMQKYIRRSRFVKAIYAAFELDMFALIEAEGIRSNLIHRLMIIFMEDVANPGMWPWMDKQIFELLSLREKRKGTTVFSEKFCDYRQKESEIIARIVYALSTSLHSRENSFYRFVFWTYLADLDRGNKKKVKAKFPWFSEVERKVNIQSNRTISIPGLSSDEQAVVDNFVTLLEKRNDGAVYFAHLIYRFPKLSSKFYNSTKPSFLIFYLINKVVEKLYKGDDLKRMKEFVDIGVRWFKELSPIKEEFLCWQYLLLIIINNRPILPYVEDPKAKELSKLYRRNVNQKVVEFDEWVYDMHTKIGKKSGKSFLYFATESSKVHNEDPSVNTAYKAAYTYNNKLREGIEDDEEEVVEVIPKRKKEILKENESDAFEFVVRAQLNTSDSKADTYFAVDKGNLVFVKGPFEPGSIDEFMEIQEKKEKLGLPTLKWRSYELIPDLFPDEPLGYRRKVDRSKKYPFLVSEVLFDHTKEDLPIKVHSSKVWPDTEVVDWTKVKGAAHITKEDFANPELMRQFVENIFFRYVYGIGDLAKRNFIVKDGMVYSIDEDAYGRDFVLENTLKESYPAFTKYVEKNKKELRKFLKKFEDTNDRLQYLDRLVQ